MAEQRARPRPAEPRVRVRPGDAKAPGRKKVQYFDNNGSRAIYQDGSVAATFGPLVPWLPGAPGLAEWDSAKDKWELYNITRDFSEADDLAAKEPQRLAQLQKDGGALDERGQPRSADRLAELKAAIARKEADVAAIKREITKLGNP